MACGVVRTWSDTGLYTKPAEVSSMKTVRVPRAFGKIFVIARSWRNSEICTNSGLLVVVVPASGAEQTRQ